MNPKDFSWTEDQSVTVTNPTNEDYTWKVHGKDYTLGAGKTAKMPGFIAWLYVYGQSVKMAQADGQFTRWNEEGFRQEYYDKFVAGIDDLVQVVPEEQPALTVFGEDSETATSDKKAKNASPSKV